MTDLQRRKLREITETPGFGDTDWDLFVAALEFAVRYFLGYKELAKSVTAAKVRRNLKRALRAAENAEPLPADLDGFSRMALSYRSPDLLEGGASQAEALRRVVDLADLQLAKRGQRVHVERDHLAALVLQAFRKHTSAPVSQLRGGLFEQVLIFAFSCAGIEASELHTLVERVCKNDFVEEAPGTTLLRDRALARSAGNS